MADSKITNPHRGKSFDSEISVGATNYTVNSDGYFKGVLQPGVAEPCRMYINDVIVFTFKSDSSLWIQHSVYVREGMQIRVSSGAGIIGAFHPIK